MFNVLLRRLMSTTFPCWCQSRCQLELGRGRDLHAADLGQGRDLDPTRDLGEDTTKVNILITNFILFALDLQFFY